MIEINPMLAIDAYKLSHMTMYPKGTTQVYCNLTARNFTHLQKIVPNDFSFFNDKAVVFGLSSSVQEIVQNFQKNFFDKDIEELIVEFEDTVAPFTGGNSTKELSDKFRELHALNYLPLVFKSLPEGSQVQANIPMMTWTNTHDNFAWLPNYLETYISSQVWKMITTATIAKVYKNIFDYYASMTGVDKSFTAIQGHDFSSRGMSGMIDASRASTGHLTSFIGSDAVSAVPYINKYYNPENNNSLIAISVPASEHSVMCMGQKDSEIDTYRRLLDLYPNGIVSIVSDTWDYWKLLSEGTKELKEQILNRGEDALGFSKTVFRPDSGNPVDIVCGTKNDYNINDIPKQYNTETGIINDNLSPQESGSVHVLDKIFGSTTNELNYRTLNSKVGLIYGDSITPIRAHNILRKLMKKGYASDNIVFGIGSFTYQYLTRDTLGMAVKATAGVIDGKVVKIFKEPKTDSGKKSARGFMRVDKVNNEYVLTDDLESDVGGELKVFFKDGVFIDIPTFDEIRERLS